MGLVQPAFTVSDSLGEARQQTERILKMHMDNISLENADAALRAIARKEHQIELEARMTGAFRRERENESEVAQKYDMIERAIAEAMRHATAAVQPATREEVLERSKVLIPNATNYLN